MRLVTAALAASLLAPTSAYAQSDHAVLQSRIKSILESVQAPMFGDGKPLQGYSVTYSVSGSGCRTLIEIAYPSHRIGASRFPARTERHDIDWRDARNIVTTTYQTYVKLNAPGLPAEGQHFYAGRRAVEMHTAMLQLADRCRVGGSTPAPRPTPSPSAAKPDFEFPPAMVASWMETQPLPRAWKIRYLRAESGVHVYAFEADLRENPQSSFLTGETYLRRFICGDDTMRSFVSSGVRMRADTIYISASGRRTERGTILARC